jgi:hypothetical protein
MPFDAGADRPARLDGDVAEGTCRRQTGGVEGGHISRGVESANGDAAGQVHNSARRRRRANATAQRGEPFQGLVLVEAGDFGSIRIADCAGADERRISALAGELDVGLDPCEPIAELPIVTGLRAPDDAIERKGRAGGERAAASERVVE